MKCPGCGATVAEHEAICPRCDHIIDPSFLEGKAEPPAPAGDADDEPEAPPRGGWSGSDPVPPEQLLAGMVDFLRRMRGAEAVGFWATVAVVVLCLMPWKVTALDGEVAGVASLGIVTLLGSLGALLSIILRRLRATPLSSLTLCLAQVGALALCLLWTLICIKLSFDGRLVQDSYSAAQVPISRPAFGAVAAVIASLVALIGGVGTLNQAAD